MSSLSNCSLLGIVLLNYVHHAILKGLTIHRGWWYGGACVDALPPRDYVKHASKKTHTLYLVRFSLGFNEGQLLNTITLTGDTECTVTNAIIFTVINASVNCVSLTCLLKRIKSHQPKSCQA